MEREAERQDEDEEEKSGWPAANLDALSNKQIFDTKAAFRSAGCRHAADPHTLNAREAVRMLQRAFLRVLPWCGCRRLVNEMEEIFKAQVGDGWGHEAPRTSSSVSAVRQGQGEEHAAAPAQSLPLLSGSLLITYPPHPPHVAQDFNLVAEATGPEGLYTWTVSLADFSPDSPLAQASRSWLLNPHESCTSGLQFRGATLGSIASFSQLKSLPVSRARLFRCDGVAALQDMQQAGRKFGVSSVQLQLHFKRGLHPFYPPSVKLMAPRCGQPACLLWQPCQCHGSAQSGCPAIFTPASVPRRRCLCRFQGPVLGALASHPLVSAERWDPFQSAKELLLSIKAFLEVRRAGGLDPSIHSLLFSGGACGAISAPASNRGVPAFAGLQEDGRVDLDAQRNRMSGPGASAYLEAEHLLARLEALSGVPSIWRCEGHTLYR